MDTVVVAAYGLLIPEPAARPRALAQRPPVAAAALARRGADRAGADGRRRARPASRSSGWCPSSTRGRSRRSSAFPIGPRTTSARSRRGPASSRAELLEEVLPEPSFTPQPAEGVTYAEKIGAADRELDWTGPPEELLNRIRALSPHIGARGELHGRPVTIWRARHRGRRARPGRGAAGRPAPDELRRVPARAAVIVARAARGVRDACCRVFEEDAYADRAFPAAAAGLDQRDRALAQRLAFGTVQRVRTLDHGIEALGRRPVAQARSARAGGAAARRVPARLLGGRRARGRQRVGRARPRARGWSARSRSRTRSCGGSRSGCATSSTRLPERRPPRRR